ncbi:MAG: DUF4255 domain-containing protein [Planctomycetota bacterium]|nr:MAG: DUF4255 domain-containing protein [Planctomycetota bacterium]
MGWTVTDAATITKRHSVQHNVLMDLSKTLGYLLQTHLPDQLGDKARIEVAYELPDPAQVDKLKKNQVLFSVVLLNATRTRDGQTHERPIVREEDEEGGLTEYRVGSPTRVTTRYMISPWTKDPLETQVALGALMQHFFSFPVVSPDDYQGVSLERAGQLVVDLDENVGIETLMAVFQSQGRSYQPSVVYKVDVVMESIFRVPVRRVVEKVNIYRKVES